MAAGIVDVLELVEVDEEQGAAVTVAHHRDDLLLEFLQESAPVVEPGQAVVVRQLEQHGVALTQCRRRRLERFDDVGNFTVFRRFEFDGQVAFREFPDRLLQVGDRCQRLAQGVAAIERECDQQDHQYGRRRLDVREQPIVKHDEIEMDAHESQQLGGGLLVLAGRIETEQAVVRYRLDPDRCQDVELPRVQDAAVHYVGFVLAHDGGRLGDALLGQGLGRLHALLVVHREQHAAVLGEVDDAVDLRVALDEALQPHQRLAVVRQVER